MKRKNRIIYFGKLIVLLLGAGSCVTPFTPKLNESDTKPLLVVEGQITDQAGPFTVKLTTAAPVDNLKNPQPVLNADVRIIDDKGHTYQLNGYNGYYQTSQRTLKGVPGNTYTLMVTTPEDGRQYTSTPVLMQDVPGIDSLYFEQVQYPRITEGKVYNENWVNVLLDTHDAAGNIRYWRWEYEETFKVAKRISEFLYDTCWVTRPSTSILVASTAEKPVNEIRGFIVRSIGPGGSELRVGYSILVKQYSIDADLYNYMKKLRDINETTGGIYGKIPEAVFGNITCCDSTGKALGYFTASTVKEKRFNIKRSDNYQIETIVFEGTCNVFRKPPFWWQ